MGCVEEFNNKINNNEYISKLLYDNFLEYNHITEIPNFNLNDYNNKVLNRLYSENKKYFDNLYKDVDSNIHLDMNQIRTILADEDYSLIIAGAGTGKTTTMVAKAKYLVDKKGVDPRRILAMSYTKKSTEELREKIVIDFGLPVEVATFHSLGFKIIRNLFSSHFPTVVETNERKEIFLKWFKEKFENKELMSELIYNFDKIPGYNFMFSKYFRSNYNKYDTFDEYFQHYKKKKIREKSSNPSAVRKAIYDIIEKDLNSEHIYTIRGELVKSKGEAIIANYLFCNGIDYEYEKVYEEILEDNKTYKPDFTLDIGGETIYIEYFGMSKYKNRMSTYEKIRAKKEEYHRLHKTKFIAVDYAPGEKIIDTLKQKLKQFEFVSKPRTEEEIYSYLLERNKVAELFNFYDLLYKVVDTIKSSINREKVGEIVSEYLSGILDKSKYEFQYNIIKDFYKYYKNELFGDSQNYCFDFSDMLYYAKKYMTSTDKKIIDFDYLIIDEYQDISYERYELAMELSKINNLKLTAIGDDWQTIFSFAGSKIDYIINFQKYFPSSRVFIINKSYRNPKGIVESAGTFMMKNSAQIKKYLESNINVPNPIIFVEYAKYMDEVLKEIIKEIYKKNPNDTILLLSRRNKTINELFLGDDFADSIDTKVIMKELPKASLDAMTIHKAKGLTADQVIIIDPYIAEENGNFWLISLFESKHEKEPVEDAEERRIFYVALTRTKNKVYILDDVSRESKNFMYELRKIICEHRKPLIDKTSILSKEEQKNKKAIYLEDTLSEDKKKLFNKLRKWRKAKSIAEDIPLYYVFSNKDLINITLSDVLKKEDLLNIKGIKKAKYEKYGDELYNILMEHNS